MPAASPKLSSGSSKHAFHPLSRRKEEGTRNGLVEGEQMPADLSHRCRLIRHAFPSEDAERLLISLSEGGLSPPGKRPALVHWSRQSLITTYEKKRGVSYRLCLLHLFCDRSLCLCLGVCVCRCVSVCVCVWVLILEWKATVSLLFLFMCFSSSVLWFVFNLAGPQDSFPLC